MAATPFATSNRSAIWQYWQAPVLYIFTAAIYFSTGRLAWPFGLLLGGFFLFFHAELLSVFFGLGLVLPAFISHNALIFLHDVTKRLATGGSYAFNCSSVPPAAIIAWMPPTRRMPLRFKRMGQRVVKPPRR